MLLDNLEPKSMDPDVELSGLLGDLRALPSTGNSGGGAENKASQM